MPKRKEKSVIDQMNEEAEVRQKYLFDEMLKRGGGVPNWGKEGIYNREEIPEGSPMRTKGRLRASQGGRVMPCKGKKRKKYAEGGRVGDADTGRAARVARLNAIFDERMKPKKPDYDATMDEKVFGAGITKGSVRSKNPASFTPDNPNDYEPDFPLINRSTTIRATSMEALDRRVKSMKRERLGPPKSPKKMAWGGRVGSALGNALGSAMKTRRPAPGAVKDLPPVAPAALAPTYTKPPVSNPFVGQPAPVGGTAGGSFGSLLGSVSVKYGAGAGIGGAVNPFMNRPQYQNFAYRAFKKGGRVSGKVPGKARVRGDSTKNDVVPALLSPGEIVVPRTSAKSMDRSVKFLSKVFRGGSKRSKNDTGKMNKYQAGGVVTNNEVTLVNPFSSGPDSMTGPAPSWPEPKVLAATPKMGSKDNPAVKVSVNSSTIASTPSNKPTMDQRMDKVAQALSSLSKLFEKKRKAPVQQTASSGGFKNQIDFSKLRYMSSGGKVPTVASVTSDMRKQMAKMTSPQTFNALLESVNYNGAKKMACGGKVKRGKRK
jgi:hypothetical protein